MESTEASKLDAVYERYTSSGGNIIFALQEMQNVFGFIPEHAVDWLSDRTGVPASRFYGVATFYSQFCFKPRGRNTLTICCGAACHIKGSDKILDHARDILGLADGEDTTANLSCTIQKATCIGACNIAPVAILNDVVHANVDIEKVTKLVRGYEWDGEFFGVIEPQT